MINYFDQLTNRRVSLFLLPCYLLLVLLGCNYPPLAPTEDISEAIDVRIYEPQSEESTSFGFTTGNRTLNNFTDQVGPLSPGLLRRTGIVWAEIEPIEGQRNWELLSELENELILASDLGFDFILIVRTAPSWAHSIQGNQCGPIKEEKLSSFANFMYDIVTRYSVPPFNVKNWEIWNEPDIASDAVPPESSFGCWGNRNDKFFGGGYYAEMLKIAYPQIKAADPEANVLIGGLLLDCDPGDPPEESSGSDLLKDCSSSNFLEGILANDGGNYFDGVSFHAYDYYSSEVGFFGNSNWKTDNQLIGPVFIKKTAFIEDLLLKYGVPQKKLYNTKSAIICGSSGHEEYCLTSEFQLTKAAYVTQSLISAMSLGLDANIWHNLTGWRGSGLLTKEHNAELAYDAFQTANQELNNAVYIGEVKLHEQIVGHEIQRGQSTIWVLWSLYPNKHMIELPFLPTRVFDLFGQPLEPTRDLLISSLPVYIYWDKGIE